MQGFLNLGAVAFLHLASKLALKGNGNTRRIEFLHPLVYIFLSCHANLYKTAGITGLVKR